MLRVGQQTHGLHGHGVDDCVLCDQLGVHHEAEDLAVADGLDGRALNGGVRCVDERLDVDEHDAVAGSGVCGVGEVGVFARCGSGFGNARRSLRDRGLLVRKRGLGALACPVGRRYVLVLVGEECIGRTTF